MCAPLACGLTHAREYTRNRGVQQQQQQQRSNANLGTAARWSGLLLLYREPAGNRSALLKAACGLEVNVDRWLTSGHVDWWTGRRRHEPH